MTLICNEQPTPISLSPRTPLALLPKKPKTKNKNRPFLWERKRRDRGQKIMTPVALSTLKPAHISTHMTHTYVCLSGANSQGWFIIICPITWAWFISFKMFSCGSFFMSVLSELKLVTYVHQRGKYGLYFMNSYKLIIWDRWERIKILSLFSIQ